MHVSLVGVLFPGTSCLCLSLVSITRSVISCSISKTDSSSVLASKLSKSLFPCVFQGSFNNVFSFVRVISLNSFHLLHVLSNLLSIWHHFSFHVSVGFSQVVLKRMGGVSPDSAHLIDSGHVDVDSQLSGIENAEEGDHG